MREFIFRSTKGGYIEIFEDYGITNNFNAEALYELYKCPSLGNEDVWMGIQFNATPKLIKILQENNLLAWEKMHSIEENENLKRMFLSDCKP